MNDSMHDDAIQALLHSSLFPAEFSHRDHLRLAWYLTHHHDLALATQLITTSIRTVAIHHGQTLKYHETMTQFWIRLVAHLVQNRPDITDFDAFLMAFPQLLEKDLPYRHWRRETMHSETARAQWVEPDVLVLPSVV